MDSPALITCRIGLRQSQNRCVRLISITSPRTGKTLEMYLCEARERLAGMRIVSRIAAAVGTGRHEAAFTAEELKAFKAAVDRGPTQPRRGRGILGGGF